MFTDNPEKKKSVLLNSYAVFSDHFCSICIFHSKYREIYAVITYNCFTKIQSICVVYIEIICSVVAQGAGKLPEVKIWGRKILSFPGWKHLYHRKRSKSSIFDHTQTLTSGSFAGPWVIIVYKSYLKVLKRLIDRSPSGECNSTF